jgi:PAS domain S-box-containing protein
MAKLARVADMTPHAVVLYDRPGRIEWVNARFTVVTGITLQDARGMSPRDLFSCPDETRGALERAVEARGSLRTEVFAQSRQEGRGFWIDLDLRPMFTAAGEFDGYMAIWVEVARTKAMERGLELQSATLRSANRLARVGGWEMDLVAGVCHWSPELREIIGTLGESTPIAEILATHDPEVRAVAEAQIARVIKTGERMEFRSQAINGSGEPIWLKVIGEPVIVNGRCVAIRGATQDVTEEYLAERRLRRSEAFAQGVIDRIPSQLFVLDETHRVIAVNKACTQAWAVNGLPDSYPMGRDLEDVLKHLPKRYAGKVRRGVRRVLDGDASGFVEIFKYGVGRDVLWMQVQANRFEWEGVPRCLLIVDSIDELKRRERRLRELNATLRKARQAADAANDAKSSFLATMSHEIRTPLNAVLGMAQAMANEDLPEAQRSKLDVIRQSGSALLGLLNDLLDLSKVEAGKLELEDGIVDMEEIASGAQAAFAALAGDKDIQLRLAVAPEARGCWLGDPSRTRQVVYNLIGNAVKFTERGEVVLEVDHDGRGLVIRVSDTGPGIPADRRSKLFEKFVQADASTTRRYGGSGLGLAICRELVILMNGEITLDSVESRGSTFTVRLPLARAEQTSAKALTASVRLDRTAPHRKLRVLAAEDNPMNQLVLKTLMAQVGIEPHMVDDGEQALQAWASSRWDVILMDVQMPVMDGPTAARLIRERERAEGRARTPIIALTANAMSHHTAMYLSAGMDALAAKPIDFQQLLATIDSLLDEEADAPEAPRLKSL